MNSRDQFEAAMVNTLKEIGDDVTAEQIVECRKGDEYKAHSLSSAWWAWQESRRDLIARLRELEWAPSVLQEAIDATGVEPC